MTNRAATQLDAGWCGQERMGTWECENHGGELGLWLPGCLVASFHCSLAARSLHPFHDNPLNLRHISRKSLKPRCSKSTKTTMVAIW